MINLMSKLFVVLALFTSMFAQAQAFGPQLTYHGRILDTNGGTNVPVTGNVTFLLQIVHPDVPTCVLYQETQTQNLTAADGNFTLTVNGGSSTLPVALLNPFADVFITDPSRSINCINGGTVPGSTNSRRLNVYFVPPGGGTVYEPLPSQTINYVPLAVEALNTNAVGGFGASSLLRVVEINGFGVPVPYAVPAITRPLYEELDRTIKGQSEYYVTSAGTVANFSGALQGEITGVQSATVLSRIFNRPLTTVSSTFMGGEVLFYNGTNWIAKQGSAGTVQSVTSANNYLSVTGAPPSNNPTIDALLTINIGSTANTVAAGDDPRIVGALQANTPLSGDVTGLVSTTVVATVGGKTAAAIATSVEDTQSATSSLVNNALVRRDGSGNVTVNTISSTNNSTRNLLLYNAGNTFNATINVPSALAVSYTLTLPSTSPVSGFVLATNALGQTSWISPTTGNVTSVSATAPLSSTGGQTPTISIPQANFVVDGFLSAISFTNFSNKVASITVTAPLTIAGTSQTPQIGLQNSGVSAGTYTKVVVDVKGIVTSGTTLVASDIPDLDASKITTGTLPIARGGTGAGSLVGDGFITTNAAGTALTSTVCAVSEVPYFNGTTWVCKTASSANSSSTIVLRDNNGNFTANNITTVQDMTVQRNLRVQNGMTNYIGITTPIATPSYDIVLPNNFVAPSVNQVLAVASGTTSSTILTYWVNALSDALASGSIFVGNASGTATGVVMSGDATISNFGNIQLAPVGSGVTSGTEYTKVTVDGKGRVTSGAQLNNADVTAGLGYTPMNSVSSTAPITISGGASNPVIGFENSGVVSGSYGSSSLIPNFIVDIFGRITSATLTAYTDATSATKGIVNIGSNITVTAGTISVTSGNVISALGYTPFDQATGLAGDVTGTLSATVVASVGGKTSAQISQSVSDTIEATSFNSSGTIVRRNNNGDFTANNITTVQNMTVQANLRVQDGMFGQYIGLATPIGLGASYDITLPNNATPPNIGQVLAVTTGSTSASILTTWINALTDSLASGSIFVGNASGTATAAVMSGDATISNTGNLQLSEVGAGVTSGSQYTKVTVDGKGRVTSGAQLDNADVVAGLGYVPMNSVSTTAPITLSGGASNPTIGLANSGVLATTYGSDTLIPFFTVDAFGRITSAGSQVYADATSGTKGIVQIGSNITVTTGVISVTSANIISALGTLGGDVSGTLDNTVVLTVGGKTAAQISQSVSDTIAATDLNSSGTIVRRDNNGNFTANNITTVQDMTVQRNLRVQDGMVGGSIGLTVPVGISNYNIVLPGNGAPSIGQVLAAASGTTSATVFTTWINALTDALASGSILVGNASGTATPAVMSGDATMSNLGNLQLSEVGAGVTSGSQYTKVTVDGKGRVTSGAQLDNADVVAGLGYVPMNSVSSTAPITLTGGASNPIIGLADSGVLATTYGSNTLIPFFTVDAFGRITSAGSQVYADATSGTKGIVQIGSNITVTTGVISVTSANIVAAMGSLGGDVSGTLDATVVQTVGGKTAAEISQSVSDTITATSLNSSSTIVKRDNNGDFTANNITTVQDMTVQRNLRVQNGALNYIGITTPVMTPSYDIVLPNNSVAPTVGQVLAVASGSTATVIATRWMNALTDVLAPGNIFVGNASGTATGVTMTGDATMSVTGDFQLIPVGAGVTSGTQYTKVTVDGKGRVTSGAQLVNADIVTALGYTPADDAVSGTYVRRANNLSDLLSSATARTNLGLGTLAVADSIDLGSASATGIIADDRLQTWPDVASGTIYSKVTVDGKGRVTSGGQLSNADINAALGYVPMNTVSSTSPITLTGGASNPIIGLELSGVASGTYPKVTVDLWGRVTSGTGLNFTDVTSGLGYTPVQIVSATSPIILTGSASAPVINLAFSGVTSGIYPKVTVDDWGRVTSGTNLNFADVTFGLGYTPTNTVSVTAPLALTGGASNPIISLNTTGVISGTYPKVTVDDWGRVLSGSTLAFGDVVTGLGYTPVQIVSAASPIILTGSASSPVINLAFSGVTSGTYPKVSVDDWGRVTSGTNLNFADVTFGLGYTPTNTVSVTAPLALTGGASNPIISLNTTGVISGTYPKVTVDDWGRVLSGSTLAFGDVVTGLGYTPIHLVSATSPIIITGPTSAPVLSLGNSGVIAGSYGSSTLIPTVTVDVYGRVVSTSTQVYADATSATKGIVNVGSNITVTTGTISITSANVIAAMGSLSGDVSGTLNATVVETVGTKTAMQIATVVDAVTSATDLNSSGTIVRRDVNGNFTANNITTVQDMTVQRNLRVQDGSMGGYIGITTPVGVSNYDIVLPGNGAPSTGQVLAVASGSTASRVLTYWVGILTDVLAPGNLFVGNASGTATGVAMSGDATLSSTGNIQLTSVGAGVTSGTQYTKVTVDGKGRVTSGAQLTNPDVVAALGYTPSDDAVSGTYVRRANNLSDLISSATARTNLGLGTLAVADSIDLGSASATGIIADARLQTWPNVVSGTIYTKLTVDGKGRVTSGGVLSNADINAALGYVPMNTVSSTLPITLSGGASNPTIGLAFSGVTSGTYPKVSVDLWGRVTSGSNLAFADVVTGLGYTPVEIVSATSPIFLTGPASSPVINLALSGVTSGGQYPKVTVDGWGRVTSGTVLNFADVTTGLGYTPTNTVSATSPLSITGSTSNPVISLDLSGVTSGATYPKVTVDGWGRVTSGTGLNFVDVTTGLGYTPVQIVSATTPLFLTGPASAPVINLATTTVAAGSYGSSTLVPNFTVDAWGRLTAASATAYADATTGSKGIVQVGSNITLSTGVISITSANVIAAMGSLSGDVSGTLNATVVQTVGTKTALQIATTVDAVASATSANSSGTLVRRDANGDFTARNITLVEDMTVWGDLRVQNGLTGGSIGITTPVTLGAAQNYNIILPDNGAPIAGQVLGVVSGSTASLIRTTWVNALTDYLANGQIYMGSASNTATGVTVAGDATISNVGVLTLSSIGANVTSGAQYTKVTVDGKGRVTSGGQLASTDVIAALGYTPGGMVSSTAPITISGGASTTIIGLANSTVTPGTYGSSFTIPIVSVDMFGRLTAVTSQTLRVADAVNTGVVSIGSNITVNGAGSISLTNSNVTSALGYVPVNRSGDVMTGPLTATAFSATNSMMLGGASVTTGAILEASATDKGVLIPRMTTTQRNAITTGAAQDSLQIFNTTTRAFEYYDAGAVTWRQMVTNNTALTSLNGSASSTQFFSTGSAGTSFGVATSTAGVHTFNFPMAASAGVTQGAISNTQYQSFIDKVTSVSGVAGQIVITGSTSSPVVGLATSGLTAGTFGSSSTIAVMTYDTFGRATGVTSSTLRLGSATATGVVQVGNNITVSAGTISLTSANVLNAFGAGLSGDVTGSLSATVVATVGTKTALQIATVVDAVTSATSANSSGTIVRRDANGNFIANNITTVQDMTVQRNLRIQNGLTNSIGIFTPIGTPNYDIILPNNTVVPPAGYGLGIVSATAGQVQTTWIPMMNASIASGTFYVGNASGVATAVLMSGDATMSNTGRVMLSSVGANVTSGSQYTKVTVNGQGRVVSGGQLALTDVIAGLGYSPSGMVSSTAPITISGGASTTVIGLANSTVTPGTYGSSFTIPIVTVDMYGRLITVTSQTLRVADTVNPGVVSIGNNITVNGAGQISLTSTNVANAFGAGLLGDVTGTLSATTVALVGGKTSAQVSQSVSDTLTATSLNTASMIMRRDAAGAVSAGAISQSQAVLRGSTAGTLTLQASATTTPYVLTFPGAQGAANQVLSNDGTGALAWVTALTNVLASGTINIGDATGVATPRILSGDVTMSNTGVVTLASTITAATTGSSSAIPVITYDAKGRLTTVTTTAYQDATTASKGVLNVPAAGNLTVTAGAISLTGSGVTSALGTQTANTFYSGPLSGAAANPTFRTIASSDLPATGLTGVWLNGGNSFGTTTVLGTMDNNALAIKTNGVTRLTINSTGSMTATVSAAAFAGQAYSAVNAQTPVANVVTADANLGNVITFTTATAAAHTVNVTNVQPGAAYTISVVGAGANTGQVNINCNGNPASYIPANGVRVSGGARNKTIYTFIYDGTDCLVTWITGF